MIRIENKYFVLELGEDCVAQRLVLKSTGVECLVKD